MTFEITCQHWNQIFNSMAKFLLRQYLIDSEIKDLKCLMTSKSWECLIKTN